MCLNLIRYIVLYLDAYCALYGWVVIRSKNVET